MIVSTAGVSTGDELLTTVEVAQLLRAAESTVRYWRHRGEGPECFRVGRRVVYTRRAVDAWLVAQAAADARFGGSAA